MIQTTDTRFGRRDITGSDAAPGSEPRCVVRIGILWFVRGIVRRTNRHGARVPQTTIVNQRVERSET